MILKHTYDEALDKVIAASGVYLGSLPESSEANMLKQLRKCLEGGSKTILGSDDNSLPRDPALEARLSLKFLAYARDNFLSRVSSIVIPEARRLAEAVDLVASGQKTAEEAVNEIYSTASEIQTAPSDVQTLSHEGS